CGKCASSERATSTPGHASAWSLRSPTMSARIAKGLALARLAVRFVDLGMKAGSRLYEGCDCSACVHRRDKRAREQLPSRLNRVEQIERRYVCALLGGLHDRRLEPFERSATRLDNGSKLEVIALERALFGRQIGARGQLAFGLRPDTWIRRNF